MGPHLFEPRRVDEQRRREFERLWIDGRPGKIEDFLPDENEPSYLDTIAELVRVEFEFTWKRWTETTAGRNAESSEKPPLLEVFLERFSLLRREDVLAFLIREEYRARRSFGDRPSVAEYSRRFPDCAPDLDWMQDETVVVPNADTPKTSVPGDVCETRRQEALKRGPIVPGHVILSELGRGGMGVVYRALDLQSDQNVAIKFVRAYAADLDRLARFRIEAEAVALLRHRNIVPVISMGVAMGYPYIVLEYVGGGNLANKLRKGRLGPVRAASIAEGIARGLAHSHRLSILHRDLKPQNILLTDQGVPRITDFGLAKITSTGRARQHLRSESIAPVIHGSLQDLMQFEARGGRLRTKDMKQHIEDTVDLAWQDRGPSLEDTTSLSDVREFVTEVVEQSIEGSDDPFGHEVDQPTQEGQIVGTPVYMAPEQTYGDTSALGPHTDTYALGVILYEMLSGSVPHKGKRIVDLFRQIRFDAPPTLHRDVPPTLRRICEKCMARSPDDRYKRADYLADDLSAFLESDEAKLADRGPFLGRRIWSTAGNFVRRASRFPGGQ